MAGKSFELHPAAVEELGIALRWYADRSQKASERLLSEFDSLIGLIKEAPQRWPADTLGVRRVVMKRFPFAIVYRDTDSKIQIIPVAHGHRRPGYWKSRF